MKAINRLQKKAFWLLLIILVAVAAFFFGRFHADIFSSNTQRRYAATVISKIQKSDDLVLLHLSNYKIASIKRPDKVFGVTINGLISGSNMVILAPSQSSVSLDLSSIDAKRSYLDKQKNLHLIFRRGFHYSTKLTLKKLRVLSLNEGVVTSIISRFGNQAQVLTKQNAEYQRIEDQITTSLKRNPKVEQEAKQQAENDLRQLFRISFDSIKKVDVAFD